MSEEIHVFTVHAEGDPLAEVIAEFQKAAGIDKAGEATHAGLRLMANGGTQTYEALPTGVHFAEWARMRGQKIHEFRWTRASVARQQAAFYLLQREWTNKPYAYGQLLAIGWWCAERALGEKHPKLLSRRLTVCSELVWRDVQHLGGEEFESLRAYRADKDLFFPPNLLSWATFTPLLEEV